MWDTLIISPFVNILLFIYQVFQQLRDCDHPFYNPDQAGNPSFDCKTAQRDSGHAKSPVG